MYAGVFFLRKADIYTAVYLLNLNHLPLFIYFVLGIVIHKHFATVCQCIENKYALGAIIVASCILNIYTFGGGSYIGPSSTMYFMLLNTGLLLIVFSLFRQHADFCKENLIGKFLQYIGKHTLEIYLIHYFFIPRNLQTIGNFFAQNSNPELEYLTAIFFAIIVICISLLASSVIRISPLSAHWLLGIKQKNKSL